MTAHQTQFIHTASGLGLSYADARAVLRTAQTLHTWAVHECNGTKRREQTQGVGGTWADTGRVHWYNPNTGKRCGRTPDLEAGALRRLGELCNRLGLEYIHQGDPRGYVVKLVKDGCEFGVPSRG